MSTSTARTCTSRGRVTVVAAAALLLLAGAPLLATTAAAAPASDARAIDLSPATDSASAGTCAPYVVTLTGAGGGPVAQAPVDVVVRERTPTAARDVDLCTAVTGGKAPATPGGVVDTGPEGSSDRGQVTTGDDGTVVIGVTSNERGTIEIDVYADSNGDDVRQATEYQDTSLLYVTAGGPAGSADAANAVQCADARPESDTNFVGEAQTVSVVLTNNVTTTSDGTSTARGLVRDVDATGSNTGGTGAPGSGTCRGDTVAGVTPTLTVSGANAGATATCGPSNNAGIALCTYPATAAGNDTVRVFVNQTDGAGGPAADANEPGDAVTRRSVAAPSGLQISLTCADDRTSESCSEPVPAGTSPGTTRLVASVQRPGGQGTSFPVEGVIVRFTEDGAAATISTGVPSGTTGSTGATTTNGTECVTGSNGTCAATLTEQTPVSGEVVRVTATIRGQDPAGDAPEDTFNGPSTQNTSEVSSDTATVTYRNAPRDARFVDLRPEGPVTTQSGGLREFSALVTDVNGSPVPGVQVVLTETGAGAFRTGGSSLTVVTDGAGIARADVTSEPSETGSQQITASLSSTATSCSAAAGSGGTGTTPGPAAGTCSDSEEHTFATTPPSPTPSPGAGCSTPARTSVFPAAITAGQAGEVSVLSTPGRTVELLAYSRPSTAYRVVRTATQEPDGTLVFSVIPTTNTRLYAREVGCTVDPVASSVVLTVRSALNLSATRLSARLYTFSGQTLPVRPGQIVNLYRVSGGSNVLTAQARTGADGRWSVTRRFLGSGLFDFVARTGTDITNAGGASSPRRTLIY